MLRLAYEAAKVEMQRLLSPWPVATEAPPAPAPQAKWESPAYHTQVLGSTTCTDCEQLKAVGRYRCVPCHEKGPS